LSYPETSCFIKQVNPELLKVAVDLLHEHGWEALTLDRIAEQAGVARVTVWRHGITRGSVETMLRHRLAADYRDTLSGPATAAGTGQERLAAALVALCEVAERNLPLLAHTETAFHGPDLDAVGILLDFYGPWMRILEAGEADGTLSAGARLGTRKTFIGAVTNMVVLTYVHLRAYHADDGWLPASTAAYIIKLVTDGYLGHRANDSA
jgi:AcrR family transcriptional regulator